MASNIADPIPKGSRLVRRATVLLRKGRLFPALEIGCAAMIAFMLVASYWIIDSYHGREALLPASLTSALLVANLLPAMGLMALVGRRVALRRGSSAGGEGTGRLHVRLVALFSLVSSIPVLMVVVFASLLFQYGVEFWFSDRARTMLENASDLAQGYYAESRRDVSAETIAMASDLRQYLREVQIDSPEFAEGYVFQVISRKLNESAIVEMGADGVMRTAAIIDPDNRASADRVTPAIVRQLEQGKDVVVTAGPDRLEVVTALDPKAKIYVYAARASNQSALSQWQRAQTVLNDYEALSTRSQSLQVQFNIALFFGSLLLVGIALWAALKFADRMVRPLSDMVGAARAISTGDFAARVDTANRTDEVGMLGRAFNRMAARLAEQTSTLLRVNNQLDDRRAFIEAVLESVTAGVISVDTQGIVRLMNSMAQQLLALPPDQALDRPLADVMPQLARMAEEGVERSVLQYARGGDLLTFAVKAVREPYGLVITFEDITQQLLDQRQAAWSDVARRIAHEIKNPLTPIQLAAERLKRRYAKEVAGEDNVFAQLTDTIVRQVGDLRNMVDEFSSFARLPKPVFREENFFELVRQAVFLQEVAHPEITYSIEGEHGSAQLFCDRRQIGQAVTNILKNAFEAIEARLAQQPDGERGRIAARVLADGETLSVAIEDNGIGLPADKERIVEPYMTTREKGTGLGLAIVKKIVEEHHGDISFEPRTDGGARVVLRFSPPILAQVAENPGDKQIDAKRRGAVRQTAGKD